MTIKLQNGSVPSAINVGSTAVLSVYKGADLLWSTTPTDNVSLTFTPGSNASGPVNGTLPATHRFNRGDPSNQYNISTFETIGTPVTSLRFTSDTTANALAFKNSITAHIAFSSSTAVSGTLPKANWVQFNNVITNTNSGDIGNLLSILGGNLPSPDNVTITKV